MIESHQIGYGK